MWIYLIFRRQFLKSFLRQNIVEIARSSQFLPIFTIVTILLRDYELFFRYCDLKNNSKMKRKWNLYFTREAL